MIRAKVSALAVTAMLTLSLMTPGASAQDLGDLVDLTCAPRVDGPVAPSGAHQVTASGGYRCGTVRPSVGVAVCLQYNGVTVTCDQQIKTNDTDAEADVEFACVPGLWTATAVGVATGGLPGGAVGFTVPLDCDPLK